MRRYDATSRSYDELYGEEQGSKFIRVLENIEVRPDSVVLDAGCGSGLLFRLVAPIVKTIVGVDTSKNLLISAKERMKKYENAHLIRADVDNMPFGKGVFDIVFAFTVLQNMPKPVETLRSLRQVAIHGALIVVTGLKKHFSLENFVSLLERVELGLVSLIDEGSLKCYVAVLRN
jgi:ubiquinone/menaquinone biosynthesis C-methylase UbiE